MYLRNSSINALSHISSHAISLAMYASRNERARVVLPGLIRFIQASAGMKRKHDGRMKASVERGEQREQMCKNVRMGK